MDRPGLHDGIHRAALTVRARSGVTLLAGLALLGCASPPVRPEIAAPEPTGPIDAAALAGSWSCRDLNPLPSQPVQTVTTSYAADGSFVSVSEIIGRIPAPPIRVRQAGRWHIDGDQLITSEVRTTAKAVGGDPETDALLQASAELIDQVGTDREMASAILRLDGSELLAPQARDTLRFVRQSRDFHAAWCQAGLAGELLELAGADHFSILDAIEQPASPLHAALIRLAQGR